MAKRIYPILLLMLLFVCATAIAQTGIIRGKVTDANTKEGLPFATVQLKQNGVLKTGVTTDLNGAYKFSSLSPGNYDVQVSFVGYTLSLTKGILVKGDQSTYYDVKMTQGKDLQEVIISDYREPLIDKGKTSSGGTVTREEIKSLASRDVGSIAATAAGVTQADGGRELNVRGSRSASTVYFIDGVRVRGGTNLPNQAIEQTTVITGGLPAVYGDATGGVISISTRGPSNIFFGGAEILSSVPFSPKALGRFQDPYNYNLGALSLSGPLLFKKDKDGKKERSILGFFISGEYESQADGSPSAVGVWQLKDELLADIQKNPLRQFGEGFVPRTSFLNNPNDYVNVKVRPDAGNNRLSFSGKLDFQPTNNITVTLGGTYDQTSGRNYSYAGSLLNSQNNSVFKNSAFRTYARFRQKFGGNSKDQSASLIQNAFYTFQVDYTQAKQSDQDANLGQNPFQYGHFGYFQTRENKVYDLLRERLRRPDGTEVLDQNGNPIDGITTGNVVFEQQGWGTNNVTYRQSMFDQTLSNYDRHLFELLGNRTIQNFEQLQQLGGAINGQLPGRLSTIYGVFSNPGRQTNGYNFSETNLFRLTGQTSGDIGGHAINIGFEFDQRTDRAFNFDPFATTAGLWGQARSLANAHIQERDLANPILSYDSFGLEVDSVLYNRLYIGGSQTTFDKNVRALLGLKADGLDAINIDNLDPNTLSLDMFSANELLNQGNGFVDYYGYDYTGKKTKARPGNFDFFKDEVNRPRAAFAPVYVAGYIEDKFDFDDLVFRVGVRVDRFDANQPVLKDDYSLFPTKTVKEVRGSPLGSSIPSTVGEDFVVYVKDANATEILGYRQLDPKSQLARWYDANGTELRTAAGLAQNSASGVVTPFLVDFQDKVVGEKAFKDYAPQINVMPRISFSFPISDEAQFFAHYDVLTARPTSAFRYDPTVYAFYNIIGNNTVSPIANPNLRPERTIDYELGFKQKLNAKSALTITAFYREMRDMIQVIGINFAYPQNYQTYGNIDFGTVKGLTMSYDLRRTQNVRLTANYTLQFADGTGSGVASAQNIINSGLDGIRTPTPLNYDIRHNLVTTIDFRTGADEGRIFGKKIFGNMGFNIVANANTGSPYTRQSGISADGDAANLVTAGRSQLKGTINGSRLPSVFRMNLRIDKNVDFKVGKNSDDKPKLAQLNIYLQVLNALNNQNILDVYRATGSPSNDGFLDSPFGAQTQRSTLDAIAFRELYSRSMVNPNNFSLPRRIRLGVAFNF